jgi:Fe-S-cluster containining protein
LEKFACIQCGLCCKDHYTLITFRDLREIHQSYPEIKLDQLIVIHELGEEYQSEDYMKLISPLRFGIPGWPPQGYLGLQFTPFKEENICPFLDPETVNCKIYSHRPMLCRKYPYSYNDSGEFIIQKVQCPGRRRLNDSEIEIICKIIDRTWNTYHHFQEEIEEWNKQYRGKTLENFLEFILKPRPSDIEDK